MILSNLDTHTALDNNIFLVGIAFLFANLGGRYIVIDIPDTVRKFFKLPIMRRITIFFLLYLYTRSIIYSIIFTLLFIFLIRIVLNEKHDYSIVKKELKIDPIDKDDVKSNETLVSKTVG